MRSAAIIPLTFALAAGAHAQLLGTVMQVEQDFADCLTMGEYTYGKVQVFARNNNPDLTWTATSPAHFQGYENSVHCDYAKFKLGTNAHTVSYMFFTEIDLQPENVQAFNSAGKKIGIAHVNDFSFYIELQVDDILAGPSPEMVVAWDNAGGCYADMDGDGVLDLFDFLEFTNLFNAKDFRADCEANEVFDLFDFLCFTNAFNAGC